jgi:hypothetical protein
LLFYSNVVEKQQMKQEKEESQEQGNGDHVENY